MVKILMKGNLKEMNKKEFQKHLAQAEVIQGLMSFPQVNENNRVDPNDIVNNCPDLNVDKAKLIIKTIHLLEYSVKEI